MVAASLRKLAMLVMCAAGACLISLPAVGQNFQVIHTFTGNGDGFQPIGGLTIGPGGKLYGSASDYTGPGSVFQMTSKNGSWLFTTLATFYGAQYGAIPFGRPVFGPGGILYGTNSQYGGGGIGCGEPGCGAVYSLRAPTTICRAVSCPWTIGGPYSFTGLSGDGDQPYYVDPAFDSLGNLYGTTIQGGAHSMGIVFKLTRNNGNWDESVLVSFDGSNGMEPVSGVVFDQLGNIYGTTIANVYKLEQSGSSWIATTLFNFPDPATQGAGPFGPPLPDSAGNLYGSTPSAGPGGGGTVFELSPSGQGWSYSVLYSFSGTDFGGPQGNLVMDSAGNLYGTTYTDGAYGYGSVWKLTRTQNGWDYTDLHDFTGGTDGANPVAGPTIDANGNLYGTASLGGSTAGENCQVQGCGVVWSISQ